MIVSKKYKKEKNCIEVISWGDSLKRVLIKYKIRKGQKYCMCIGLNPSKANSTKFDNTVINMIAVLSTYGWKSYSGLYLTNLLTVTKTNSNELRMKDYKSTDSSEVGNIIDDAITNNRKIILFYGPSQSKKIKKWLPKNIITKIKQADDANLLYITVNQSDRFAHARILRKVRKITSKDYIDCGLE